MTLGLTGRYSAGKDTVARLLEARGWRVLDADRINHEILAAHAGEIIDAFGPGIKAADGGVDRRALGRIVFADPGERTRLEGIVYPLITARIRGLLAETSVDTVINAPLLHRAGLHLICDAVLFVHVPAVVRLVRAMRRDRLSLRDAVRRLRSQKDVRPQFNAGAVDTYIVGNAGSTRSLERRVARLDERLRLHGAPSKG
jgi:dephospho-CoA kinase